MTYPLSKEEREEVHEFIEEQLRKIILNSISVFYKKEGQ